MARLVMASMLEAASSINLMALMKPSKWLPVQQTVTITSSMTKPSPNTSPLYPEQGRVSSVIVVFVMGRKGRGTKGGVHTVSTCDNIVPMPWGSRDRVHVPSTGLRC